MYGVFYMFKYQNSAANRYSTDIIRNERKIPVPEDSDDETKNGDDIKIDIKVNKPEPKFPKLKGAGRFVRRSHDIQELFHLTTTSSLINYLQAVVHLKSGVLVVKNDFYVGLCTILVVRLIISASCSF